MTDDVNIALAELKRLLGPKGFTDVRSDMEPWLADWRRRYHGNALAMLSPKSRDEVQQIVQIASANHLPIVPQGGNSGMSGGATPDQSGTALLLSLRRMNRIVSVSAKTGQAVCEAGAILQNLHDATAQKDMRFPLTLGGKGSATIGGLISTNAGGTQVLRHGTMRALVLGLEAVLPDGSFYEGLRPLKKDNRGYDLKHLLIGAEGTLGIVTAATLSLVPALIDRSVAWVGVNSPEQAYDLLQFLRHKKADAIEGFELIQDHCLQSVLQHISEARAPLNSNHPWHVLIEFAQDDPTSQPPRQTAETALSDAMANQLLADATLSSTEKQAGQFWHLRDSISEAERASGPAVQHDISVPVDTMAKFIELAIPKVEEQFPGTKAIAFGHLGDGNVHFHVKAPLSADPASWQHDIAPDISRYVHDVVLEHHGSISAEHGIGQMKVKELARTSANAHLNALIAIKNALDPLGIMNPGKLVPLASNAASN